MITNCENIILYYFVAPLLGNFMKTVEVVAAIVVNKSKILCTQRGMSKFDYISKKYEFPGGKVELNESRENALIRELKEELHMDVTIVKHYLTVEHTYPDFKIIMHSYLCDSKTRYLVLTEHLEALWLSTNELESLDWAGADIPIVEKLKG
jgi:8-oxo-dGTP diphosphatase